MGSICTVYCNILVGTCLDYILVLALLDVSGPAKMSNEMSNDSQKLGFAVTIELVIVHISAESKQLDR